MTWWRRWRSRRRPLGVYVCSAPKCRWAWTHGPRGVWSGPCFPEEDGTWDVRGIRHMTWERLADEYADCAPRLEWHADGFPGGPS